MSTISDSYGWRQTDYKAAKAAWGQTGAYAYNIINANATNATAHIATGPTATPFIVNTPSLPIVAASGYRAAVAARPQPTARGPVDLQALRTAIQAQQQAADAALRALAALPVAALAPHGFNKYVNGSDLLEEFIAYLGQEGVRKSEIMGLPVELFIKWLIIRACEQDQEEPGVVLELPVPKGQPRCLGCRRWMPRTSEVLLHGEQCASRYFARVAA